MTVLSDREKLILEGIKHINYVLQPYKVMIRYASNQDVSDLVSESLVAVIECADRYDPDHPSGASFMSFVIPRIRGAIVNYLTRMSPMYMEKEELGVFANNGGSKYFVVPSPEAEYVVAIAGVPLEGLSKLQLLYIELYYARGYSERAIAKRIGITPRAVHANIHRSINEIKVVGNAIKNL
jgi:RNA polymerase sigma factor (sigma-70 family)